MADRTEIRQLIDRIRGRWRRLQILKAATRALLVVSLAGLAGLVADVFSHSPVVLAAIGLTVLLCALGGVARMLLPLRRSPNDRQIARFVEEREPSLDDRLISAIDVEEREDYDASGFSAILVGDAARRLRELDIETVLPSESLRRAALQTVGAAALLAAVMFAARHSARHIADAFTLAAFPSRVTLEIVPGNARIKAGSALTIQARLVGNSAAVAAHVDVAAGDAWRSTEMSAAGDPRGAAFRLPMDSVSTSFKYRVTAGGVVSPEFEITVVRPPRVARIDVDYTFPSGLKLRSKTERDSGDIYAPAGTEVKLHVVTDRPAAAGQIALADGRTMDLTPDQPNQLSAALTVGGDGSYRVALSDREGLSNPGDTEYFIRVLEDRPPDVRILKPATDRAVTALEEVDVEAQAEDDYGVDRLDLVYSVRGGAETVVPLRIPRSETTVSGRHTLFLEDLDVRPGDFISYYVRARDLTRGTRPNEARSDIFFLEVKPYEQEFALAQSQGAAAGGNARGSIDELVAAQKDVIVATWKLDRRAQAAKGAKSEQDIRAVARAEAELKTRVEQASSAFRETTMRDPRRRGQPQRGRGPGGPGGGVAPSPPEPLRAGQTMPEEDEMTAAAAAMGTAAATLDALKTAEARAPEMEALDHLLKAQADVKKREVSRQQAGTGSASNRSNYDLSTLFDKELQKQQQTNYETRSTSEQRGDEKESALDRIRDLARRQSDLLKQQEELARNRQNMTEEELKRELEKLTREQSELRQKVEELAKQQGAKGAQSQGAQSAQSQGAAGAQSQGATGAQSQGAAGVQSQGAAGAQSQGVRGAQSQGASGAQSQGAAGAQSQGALQDASDAMRSATNDLRRQDANQAKASGSRALERLRELERQMQSGRPDDRRRALGDMQLEARQLADAQRQIAQELGKTGSSGDGGNDAVRRLAGEQDRAAERARRLQEALARQGAAPGGSEAGKELEGQRVAERMQQAADAMRAAADRGPGTQRGSTAPTASSPAVDEARRQIGAQQDLARVLDKVADNLAASSGSPKDGESGRLAGQRARAQELQQRIEKLNDEMMQLGSRGNGQAQASGAAKTPGQSGKPGEGQAGGGGVGSDAARLREEAQRAMRETRDLMEQLRREDPSFSRGGAGFTFEGEGMSTSSPGTEAFKQDFAKWDDLRRQAAVALENAQTAISKKLQAKEAKERLAAGADDKAPAEYQKQVDDYFKAIAAKKKGS